MEYVLQAQHVLTNQFVEFVAYQLQGDAQHWWQGECRLLQLQNADIPWNIFQTAFYKKYFPESVREAKELKLMQLKQGSLSVAEYASKFEELCRFSRARVVEDYAKKVTEGRGNRDFPDDRVRDDYIGPRGQNFKKNGEGKWSRAYFPDIRCPECGNYHLNKPCWLGTKICYKYSAPGHLVRDCPHRGTHKAGLRDSLEEPLEKEAFDGCG
ncbi:uncharacterized protein LOC130966562 [Arachis stenosperma]|uniref:uncharacterized protein LOC130966562 n=1 Tax=Arachis stenosperma TaxID=217475 RepID=UPI0025AD7DA6|nr:uncharacterized protein LOC130966562 [Arachis stenosperma]